MASGPSTTRITSASEISAGESTNQIYDALVEKARTSGEFAHLPDYGTTSRLVLAFALSALALTPAVAQDYVAVRAAAEAETERKAVHEAYYAAFERVLTQFVSRQAQAEAAERQCFRGEVVREHARVR